MSAPEPEATCTELERSFERATSARGLVTRRIEIGGRLVELQFAGAELAGPLTRAFSHLKAGEGAPALTIRVADSASTGVVPRVDVRPACPSASVPGPGAVLRCIYVPDSRLVHCLDAGRRVAFCWAHAREALKAWDIAAPFRLLLAWWAETLGAQLAHGAVVGSGAAGVLLAGPSASGKSTLTLACLRRGLCTLGDDYVWIEPGSPYQAHSLYCTLKVRRGLVPAQFGDVAATDDDPSEKTTIFLADRPGVQLGRALPLWAVAALRIAARPLPLVRRGSAMEALAALGPSSLLQLPGSGAGGLARLARLVRKTPTFALEAGGNHAANAEAVASLLGSLRGPKPATPELARWATHGGQD
jgi:hypothetical protein